MTPWTLGTGFGLLGRRGLTGGYQDSVHSVHSVHGVYSVHTNAQCPVRKEVALADDYAAGAETRRWSGCEIGVNVGEWCYTPAYCWYSRGLTGKRRVERTFTHCRSWNYHEDNDAGRR